MEVKIKPPAVGGPCTVKITGRKTVELHNVMVGDTWLCTGQSNRQQDIGDGRSRGCSMRLALLIPQLIRDAQK